MHDLAKLTVTIVKLRMTGHYLPKLLACLEAADDRVLWEPHGHPNTIGGIVFHILEHVRRFTERLVHPGAAFGSGIEEFFPNRRIPADELIAEIGKTFRDFQEAISRTPLEKTDWHSLLHLMEHTGYHLGQIVDRTRRLTGREFRFCQRGIDEKALRRLVEEELADEDRSGFEP
ncbi:MAG TPA: DinB family protein [Paenibacillaceae bacterium]